MYGEPRPLSQLLSATCGGGGDDIAIATGGWAASRAAAATGRVRAGPDIRRGAAAALVGAARAAGRPAGTVPRWALHPPTQRRDPVHLARGPGWGGARSVVLRGLAELHPRVWSGSHRAAASGTRGTFVSTRRLRSLWSEAG